MEEIRVLKVQDMVTDSELNITGRVIRKNKRSIFVKFKHMVSQYSKANSDKYLKIETYE